MSKENQFEENQEKRDVDNSLENLISIKKESFEMNEENSSQEKKTKGELSCVVCGATANGYNFDAISCESCKAFFRRNAFRSLVITLLIIFKYS